MFLRVCFLLILAHTVFAHATSCETAVSVNIDTDLATPYVYTHDITLDSEFGSSIFCQTDDILNNNLQDVRILRLTTGNTPYYVTFDSCASVAGSGWQILTAQTQNCPITYCC